MAKSLKERMKDKQSELKSRSESGNIIFLKPDTKLRVRILNMGQEEEFIKEVNQFYLGSDIKGVISPSTFGEPCHIYEAYEELSKSKDPEEKELAKQLNLRKKYLAYCLIYKDEKGKEVDDKSPKFVLLTAGMYQDIIDLYLDEDEWGDMTQPDENGYDLKLSRTGSGKTDTEYSVTPCSKKALPKPWSKKVYNLDEEVRKIMPTYEETQELLDKFLGSTSNDDDDDDKKKDKKKDKKDKKKEDLPSKKVKKNKREDDDD